MHSLLSLISLTFIYTSIAKKKAEPQPIREEIAHIGCSVCNLAMEEVFVAVSEKRNSAPYRKISEDMISDILDNICQSTKDEGKWIRMYDIVEFKDNNRRYLNLEAPGGVGKCGRECSTIVSSCKLLFEEEIDQNDLSAILWKDKLKSAEELKV